MDADFHLRALRPASYLDEPKSRYDPVEGKLEIDVALAASRDYPPCSPKSPIRLTMALRDANGRPVDAALQGGAGLPGQTKALLDPSRPRDLLYAFIRSEGRDTLQVEINVDDYPRAFLYDLGRNDVTWQRNLWRIRITDPPREPVSAVQPRETLPVKFGVDSPADSFLSRGHGPSGDAVLLEIFNEQRPESSHSLQFNSDRQVAVELLEPDAAGEMKVAAAVGDFAKDVDAHGLENVAARVHAQLLRDRQVKDEDTVRVIIDGRPPRFELALASDRVIKGADIHVDVHEVITLSDLRKFDYGIEGGKMKTVEARSRSASFVILTKDLDPGEYTVRVAAENKAGNSDFRTAKVQVVEPPPPPAMKPGPSATITVRGTVRWLDGSPAAGVDVAIENPARSAKTDANGRFAIGDLPRGAYTIKAKGTTGGIRAAGEATADPAGADAAEVQIQLRH